MALLFYHFQVAVIQLLAYLAYRALLSDLPLGQAKRGYLLVALGLSFLVPGWLVLNNAVLPVVWPPAISPFAALPLDVDLSPPASLSGSRTAWWMVVYRGGVFLCGARFLRSLYQLMQQRRRATFVSARRGVRLYSLPTAIAPHTFGSWVFYPLDRPLSPAVLAHECAHARQWHTVDRLLIRVLRIFCWFNPVLWLYERAIRRNHELLADRAALRESRLTVRGYRNELLDHLQHHNAALPLSSRFSYSFTKQRLLMLTTSLPAVHALIGRVGLLAAVWSLLIIGFAERGYAQDAAPVVSAAVAEPTPSQRPELTYGEFRNRQYQQQKSKNPLLPPPPPVSPDLAALPLSEFRAQQLAKFNAEPSSPPTDAQLRAFRDADRYRVWIDGVEVPNARVAAYTSADIFRYTSAQPHHNPRNLTSIGLITHARRARTAARLAREAETFVRVGPPLIERVE